eukprot:TRINITY_DN190_c0_g1_i1.p2 TRINITY_DN190_c0_g1~~TRINITY_DN190_c0_g1_i1.p2  ORF type:complete len:202 (+),score=31.27 TRINITY_DN190_c0_g1_i1:86-691(+)
MSEYYLSLSNWVAGEVLLADVGKRQQLLEQFLKLAQALKKKNNFQSAMAIVFATQQPLVERVLRAEGIVLSKSMQMIFNELREWSSDDDNFKNYRASLKKATGPLIPFMIVHLKDLMMHEEKDDYKADGLIDWNKQTMIYDTISILKKYQENTYHEVSDIKLKSYIVGRMENTITYIKSRNKNMDKALWDISQEITKKLTH